MATLKQFKEGANSRAWRALMIVLAAVVVLSVSGYGTVIYIQLMSKVFPAGPLQLACYMGAAANFLLMLVLLVGKFVWFRPGAHEVASWLVTGVELIVAVLNMMLAFQLASGPVTGFMAAWAYLAPVSPIFSMCGAIALIMTSTEMRRRHKALEIEEEKEQAERELDLAMHQAQISTRAQYVQFVSKRLTEELNAPERQREMERHASGLVTKILAEMSLLQAVPQAPQLPAPRYPNQYTIDPATGPLPAMGPRPMAGPVAPEEMADDGSLDDADAWLATVNQRIAQERARRAATSNSGTFQERIVDGRRVMAVNGEDFQAWLEQQPVTVKNLEPMEQAAAFARWSGVHVPASSMLVFDWNSPAMTGQASLHEGLMDRPDERPYSPEDIERLRRIADAAKARGYDLDTMARFLGIPLSQIAGGSYEETLVRLALAAQARGYGLDRLERFLGLAGQGGDAGKKK